MKLLEDRIREDGVVGAGNVLKVDSFLNHQMDVPFLSKLGEELYNRFKDEGITKILTIEASGIGIACMTAQYFGVPVLFAKKTPTNNIFGDVYSAEVYSYTHERTYTIYVSKRFLNPNDKVLIVDDFLAKGSALLALLKLVESAGASVAGAGIAIEKAYQDGGNIVRNMGLRVESLARIASMTEEGIRFVED
ncbi:MAG: xanthine phosphoribosyltransferase [Ruminococcaceae bacterium]|nr:xanthine phosphoribosyltransferase [Oscillospiraceae bacterium]